MDEWKRIKAEYIAGGTSYRKLVEKYGVKLSALRSVAEREKWVELKAQAQHKTDTKIVDTVSDKEADKATKIIETADKLLDKISELIDKVHDTKGIKNISSALKDIKEIKGIKFGTRNPVNYFDSFYNSELFLRAHGTYSIKITDPIKFYTEVIPKNADRVDISAINEQYLNEFLEALGAAINSMSADGIRVSYVTSKSRELSRYMQTELDADWKELRGMEVLSVGLGGLSYDDKSREMIDMRNQGAMLGDASIREGYVQGAVARGMEAAGSNANGAAQAFMGMGMGMNTTGGFMGAASASNQAQIERDRAAREAAPGGWTCSCGAQNTGKFCSECGSPKPAPAAGWTCSCGAQNTGKFCSECGSPKPAGDWFCTNCGAKNAAGAKFCNECGQKK